jgi:hypothetical protein
VTKPKYVLLDAGPIIGLHAAGVWREFLYKYEVVVPETVKQNEALFHSEDPLTGFHEPIDLDADLGAGRIRMASANSAEMETVARAFAGLLELHEGELEALALFVRDTTYDDYFFCSADGAPIQAAAMIGLDERCISVEGLLSKIGLTRPLEKKYTNDFLQRHLKEGRIARVTRGKIKPF